MTQQQTGYPKQHQERQPGVRDEMQPKPKAEMADYRSAGWLQGKVAVVTGGDSGIGRATAIGFAKEGADVAVVYYDEHEDAAETKKLIEQEGRRCLSLAGDLGDEAFCREVTEKVMSTFGRIDILVNNAGEQHPQKSLEDIDAEQLERTFRTNIFAMFHLTKAVLPHLKEHDAIINTTSVTAYRGNPMLLDYSSTKGAIVSFTRSLAAALKEKKIRVNAVAPGPVWTPLIPSTFEADHIPKFGSDSIEHRPAHPDEIAPSYIFLASEQAAFMTGQVLHPNGGEPVES
ncbi:SDR family oxidoreductase [Rhodospirillaceae bacterium SYSU D60014]|uniref:SDR family oxidoreductase n=1 Tax=Virgifigura deserti TaxID=2268457 RepID=UPI000E6713CC